MTRKASEVAIALLEDGQGEAAERISVEAKKRSGAYASPDSSGRFRGMTCMAHAMVQSRRGSRGHSGSSASLTHRSPARLRSLSKPQKPRMKANEYFATKGVPVARGALSGATEFLKGRRISASKVLRKRQQRRCRTNAQWLENSAETDVRVPLETCWKLWEDQERIPNWMPWIHSVKVSPEDRKMSRWTLQTHQFGRDWEFSWVARLLTPIRNQKIHWRSVPGSTGGSLGSGLEVANRGQIRFYPRGQDACSVKLTISYEVPAVLAPLGGALTPVVENILRTDMRRFAAYAESCSP